MRTIELTREEFRALKASLAHSWTYVDHLTKEPHLVIMNSDNLPVIMYKLTK